MDDRTGGTESGTVSDANGSDEAANRIDDPVAFLLEEQGLVAQTAKGTGQRRSNGRSPQVNGLAGQSDQLAKEPDGLTPTLDEHEGASTARTRRKRNIPKSLRATASRQRVMALTVVDQAASSASNFALAFLVAHYSDAHELGIFAIATTTYVLAQGLVRSLTSDCMLTRSDTDDAVMARYEYAGFGSALLCASVAAGVLIVLSAFFSSGLQAVTLILALSFPLLAAQDYARYIGMSRFNPAYAVWLDGVWTVLFLALYAVLRHQHHVSLPWVFGCWCATGAAVGLYALRNHLHLHDFRNQVKFWFRSERSVGLRFAGQSLLVGSWSYLSIYLFVLIFSVTVIGQFKLATVAMGPITVMSQGVWTALVALAARYFQVDVGKAIRFVLLSGAGLALVMLLWTVGIYAAPVHTMTKLLGPAWPAARNLLPLMGVAFALAAVCGCLASGLRAIRAAKENLYLAVATVPLLGVSSLVGGLVWGVQGVLACLCVAYSINMVVATIVLYRCAHRFVPGSLTAGDDASDSLIPIEADNQNSVLPTPVVFETAERV